MLFSARIKELESQLAAITTERDTLAAANAELTTANAECATRHAEDQTAIVAANAERDHAVADLATVTTERDTAVSALAAEQTGRETAIQTEVNKRLGAAGIDPIARDPNPTPNTPGAGKATEGLRGLSKAAAYLAERQPQARTGTN